MAKIPKNIAEKIENQFYPNSRSLEVDRTKNAKKVYNYNDVKEFEAWQKNHTRSDLKGYDDRTAKQPSIGNVTRKISGGFSGEDVLMNEAERLVDINSSSGRMLSNYKKEIYDFNSFKNVVFQAWDVSGESISNLITNVRNKDKALTPLFNTSQVQSWLKDNTASRVMDNISKKYKVNSFKARKIFDKLTPQNRLRLLNQPKIKQIKKKEIKKPKLNFIKQKSKKGKIYSRTKPIKWTDNQILYLKSRIGLSPKRIYDSYISSFKTERSLGSLKSKLYRLKKTKKS